MAAQPGEIWGIVSDPYHLPRWWPRTQRVENVSEGGSAKGRKWTQVLETRDGRAIRADYRCVAAATGSHYAYEQLVAGTPFEGFLQSARTEIRLDPEEGRTRVTLESDQRLRGLSRLGGFMMRRATRRTLAEALQGLERIVAPVDGTGAAPDAAEAAG
jgi:carbon monoxide dehydrogenase subunit G